MVKWEIYQNTNNNEYVILQYNEKRKPKYVRIFSVEERSEFAIISSMLKAGLNLNIVDSTNNLINEVWFDLHNIISKLNTKEYRILEDSECDYVLIRQYFDKNDSFVV